MSLQFVKASTPKPDERYIYGLDEVEINGV